MAYDMGIYAEMYAVKEGTYGTAPDGSGGGVYHKLNFVSYGLSKQQALLPDDTLGQGRDPADPVRGGVNVTGPIVVPLCNNQSGFWLQQIFGGPTTSGAGPNYTHEFISGETDLESFSIQVVAPKIPRYRTAKGSRINEFSIEMGREVLPSLRMTAIGQDEEIDVDYRDDTPITTLTLSRFHAFTGSIKKDTVAMADIISATLTYRNNLDVVAPIRSDGLISDALGGQAAFEMSLRARVKDTTLLAVAGTTTPIELEFGYTTGANNSLLFTAQRVFLPKPAEEINGPGGIEVTFTGVGAKDTSPARMMTAVLKNQIATYP